MKFSFRHKSKGFLYVAVERLLSWQAHNQFRRINLSGLESIPLDVPVLIAANHPTAFVDPVLLGHYIDPPVYFMTRGDIFNKPLARKALEQFNMFPVKRLKDGFSGTDRLDEATEYVMNSMKERNTLCIFPEGQHHHEKRVLTLQKGIARMAFAAYDRFQQVDLQVIPVGCSYWYTDQIRDVAFFNAGTPLFIKDYQEIYQQSPATAVNKLLKDIHAQLCELSFHIEDPADDNLTERLLTLHRSEHPIGHFSMVRQGKQQFDGEQKVIKWVNTMEPEVKQELNKKVKSYLKQVQQAGLRDDALLNTHWTSFTRWIILLLGLPLFLVGWAVRFPVAALASSMVDNKIKKTEFKTSIWFGIELFGGLFWILLLNIAAFLSRQPVLIGIALSTPLLYPFSVVYRDIFDRAHAAFKAKRHPLRAALLAERKKL